MNSSILSLDKLNTQVKLFGAFTFIWKKNGTKHKRDGNDNNLSWLVNLCAYNVKKVAKREIDACALTTYIARKGKLK